MTILPARAADAPAIAEIFNAAIEERVATFETRSQSAEDIRALIRAGELMLVVERAPSARPADDRHESRGPKVVGWAKVAPYDPVHDYYSGVGEATLYVASDARRAGIGRALLESLAQDAERRGYYKLVGKIFTSNAPSIALVRACGWREVGVHRRHGRLDGEWKDVLVVERLLGDASLVPDLGR